MENQIVFVDNRIEQNLCLDHIEAESALLASSKDQVKINKDSEFTTISIDREYSNKNFQGKDTQTKIRTKIKKSNDGFSKETYITKLFITPDADDNNNVILREIFVDENTGKKRVNDQKMTLKVDRKITLEDALSQLIGESTDMDACKYIE